MGLQVFDKVVDVALIGLTESGKSTFITSMIHRGKFGDLKLLKALTENDGGLTKVTTFYELTDCGAASVTDVRLHDIHADNFFVSFNDVAKALQKLKITIEIPSNKDDLASAIESAFEDFKDRLKADFAYTIWVINHEDADKVVRNIQIKVPATDKALDLMNKYAFDSVILRDTRGFLDEREEQATKKEPTLADNALDGIQACILMNGQNSVMPKLGRDLYGDFVKSIFEAVPTFIIERSSGLNLRLNDYVKTGGAITAEVYDRFVNDPDVAELNFHKVQKLLRYLGVLDESGEATNQLIKAHKRQLMIPEVGVFNNAEVDYESEKYAIYITCVMEVFNQLLSTLSDFRDLLRKIVNFFDDEKKVAAVRTQFVDIFKQYLFSDIILESQDRKKFASFYVRPLVDVLNIDDMASHLMKRNLLGERDGITTQDSRGYTFWHTAVFAVTARNAIDDIIRNFNDYENLTSTIAGFIDDSEYENVMNTYTLEIQQCLKYVLQNSFTDTMARFSGYQFATRKKAVSAIMRTRNLWDGFKPQYGDTAIDTVHLLDVRDILENEFPGHTFTLPRVSQLYNAFCNIVDEFFASVSSNHNYRQDSNMTGL